MKDRAANRMMLAKSDFWEARHYCASACRRARRTAKRDAKRAFRRTFNRHVALRES